MKLTQDTNIDFSIAFCLVRKEYDDLKRIREKLKYIETNCSKYILKNLVFYLENISVLPLKGKYIK